MKNDQIVIATTMKYDLENPVDRVRAQLGLRLVQEAKKHYFSVNVLNDGLPSEFVNQLEASGAKMFKGGMGMADGRRHILNCSRSEPNVGVVVWTEPEKWPLIRCLRALAESILHGYADMVIPSRSREAFRSHPLEQVHIETFANMTMHTLVQTGAPPRPVFDFWFGPFLANLETLEYFLKFQENKLHQSRWDSVHLPRLDVIQAGKNVESHEAVGYFYPPEQRKIEEGKLGMMLKRLEQLKLLESYVAHAERIGLNM